MIDLPIENLVFKTASEDAEIFITDLGLSRTLDEEQQPTKDDFGRNKVFHLIPCYHHHLGPAVSGPRNPSRR